LCFNSSMVRLGDPSKYNTNPQKLSFNSSMVRLGVVNNKLKVSLIRLFQFQYGAIRSTAHNS